MRLTLSAIRSLSLPRGKSDHIEWDDALPSFGIRLRAGGARSWVVQYRVGKPQKRFTLGTPETHTPDQARAAAAKILAKVKLGGDPQADKQDQRLRATETLGAVIERHLIRAKAKLRPRSYLEVQRHLLKDWRPLRALALPEITRANVALRLAAICDTSGPYAANRARGSLFTFFTWAIAEGLADHNPVAGTNKQPERSRDRVLSDAELAAIWKACGDDDHGRIVKLLLLTGQRRDEIGALSDDEINLEQRLWSLPRERTKNRRQHDVPLPAPALDILKAAPRRAGREYLFGQGKGGFSGWSACKARLDARIAERNKKPLAPWHIHDLRRTAATGMAELGVQPHVIEAALNHVSGHKGGVAGVYNRAVYANEKRQALDLWANHLLTIIEGSASKIVSLRKA